MLSEPCVGCGAAIPLGDAPHLLVNPPDGEVVDGYLCRSCYEEHVGELVAAATADEGSGTPDAPDRDDHQPDEDADGGGDPDESPGETAGGSETGGEEAAGTDPGDPIEPADAE